MTCNCFFLFVTEVSHVMRLHANKLLYRVPCHVIASFFRDGGLTCHGTASFFCDGGLTSLETPPFHF